MNDSESFQRACAAAQRFLSYRPRSEAEVRARLSRRFPQDVVGEVLAYLRERGLIDDGDFSRLWTNSRVSFKPRSAAVIKRELLSKGIDRDIAESAIRDVDDQDSAYRAGLRLAHKLDDSDHATFRRRLWSHLQRRGFGSSVTRRAIALLWDELHMNPSDSPANSERR